jgi:hypothetical protein
VQAMGRVFLDRMQRLGTRRLGGARPVAEEDVNEWYRMDSAIPDARAMGRMCRRPASVAR